MQGQLVLSRKIGGQIVMTAPGGIPITLTVLASRCGVVRLGISADKSVTVLRSELLRKEDKQ